MLIGGAASIGWMAVVNFMIDSDFKWSLLAMALLALGMEVALDIALQASPDHPWATEHPEWFTIRPDGTIHYAENPPKRYQDIYNVNFASDDWDFPWTMLEQGAAFRAVPRALYILRDHRESFRLTTHVPRSVQLATMRRIMNKHGASEEAIRACMREARRSFLRQSLFRSTLHRWLRQRLGFDARRGWREQYR